MNKKEIILIQGKIGTIPDGAWGPKSRAACESYLRRLMPTNPWPKPDDLSMTRFFGKAGDESNLVSLPVLGLGMKYDGKEVKSIRCHKLVAASLERVLMDIASGDGAWVLGQYGGCFNDRPMRGGSRPSKHSWGAAIDLAPASNGLKTPWPTASDMPFSVMESFAKEGWVSAGAFWGRDAMHHEATS